MNILLVHETEYIDKFIFEYQIIPELLSSWGHNVYVIDFPTNWKKTSFFDFGSLRTEVFKDVRRANKKRGVTLYRPGFLKVPILSRILAFFSYFFLVKTVIRKHKIDHIILYSVPTNGLQTVFWAKYYKIPLLFRLLDVLHQLVPSKLLQLPTYLLERITYRFADELLAITPKLTEYAKRMGANPKTTSYLPSGSDIDLFYPQEKDKSLMEKLGLRKEDLVLLFAGNLYDFSGLDKIVNAFPKYLEEIPNLKLLIVGRGSQMKELEKLIKKNRLEGKVVLTGFINYEILPKYINLADICINPFEINPITDIIFPGKIYQYLACEKPVIATKLSGVVDIFPLDNKNNVFYFDDLNEFLTRVKTLKLGRVKDTNPTLQDITKAIELKLLNLGKSDVKYSSS
jgi:glycosyltransferase involved in cell wall biosynthesis